MSNTLEGAISVLGLTEAEEKVLTSLLQKGSLSVSVLGRETILPRTTVASLLPRLQKRGLVRHVERGYRSVWKIVGRPKLQEKLAEGLSYFDKELSVEQLAEKVGVKTSENSEFYVMQGLKNLENTYVWFLLNSHGQRIKGIQPNPSSETIIRKLGVEKMAQINDIVKTQRVIIEAILPESVTEIYKRMAKESLETLKTVEGRTTGVHLVPSPLLDFNADLLIGNDVAIFANWDEETLVLIRNSEFLKLLHHLYDFFAQVGKTFDQNSYVRELIEQADESG